MTETSAVKLPVCVTCPSPKPATWCRGCPRECGTEAQPNHFVDARLKPGADLIIVAEAPVIGRNASITDMHAPFTDDGGKIIKRAVDAARLESTRFKNLNVQFTYAVLCTGQDPSKTIADHCSTFLRNGIQLAARKDDKLPTILVMGLTALKSLGIAAKSQKEYQNKVLTDVEIDGNKYNIVVTISTKQVVSMSGMYTTFYNDVRRALDVAATGAPKTTKLEELTKNYIIPATIAEVKDVADLIIGYTEEGKPPSQWIISADTETNTKFPHRDTLKVLCVSFAWATGLATGIPLWHKESPYDPAAAGVHVQRILESQKPKIFHNYKFDGKVFKKLKWIVQNYKWDTMLAEHALEEDKKGLYGLKELTRVFFPEFAEYADVLHELLTQEEGDSQLENIRNAQKNAAQIAADELTGGKKKKMSAKEKKRMDGGFEKIPLATLLPYAAIDTDMTRRLALKQLVRIAEEEKAIQALKDAWYPRQRFYAIPQLTKEALPIRAVVNNTAVPVSKVLADVEFRGIRVDREYLKSLQDKLTKVIADSEAKLYTMGGKGFDKEGKPLLNLQSAGAIGGILFSEGFIHPDTGLRTFYPVESQTATGQAQTTEKVMKKLVAKYKCPFSAEKLVYSKAFKAKNTFCQNVWDLSTLDGFLHTNYNIHGTGTGRLSSNDENMQNIPKKLAGHSIKKVFVPDDDTFAFVNADAKGAEVRIFTAYSGDVQLAASLNKGDDTHCFFASKIIEAVRLTSADPLEVLGGMGLLDDKGRDTYRLTYEDFFLRDTIKLTNTKYGELLSKFRDSVKRVVFGILYGAGPKKIAETIGISHEQAQAIIDMLFQLFPSIPKYMDQTKWELRTFGYVETYFGRRRRFSVKGAASYMKGRAERQGVNYKIQSTSSDIVMGRLIHMNEPLVHDLGGRVLLTVHDSIGFQIPKKYLSQLPDFVDKHLLIKARTLYPWLPVDFIWDYEVGPSYGELKPFEAYMQNNPVVQERPDVIKEAYTEEEIRIELADTES